MDAGLVGKGIAPDDRLVEGSGLPDDIIDRSAGAGDLRGVNARGVGINAGAGAHCHNHLFQCGVARPLTEAVYRALNLPRPTQHTGEGIGCCHAQIIVAVHGEDGFVAVGHLFPQVCDQIPHFRRGCIAHRVGNIYGGGSCADSRIHNLHQKIPVGPGGVLGGKLHITAVLLRMGGHGEGGFQHLFRGHLQFVLHMHGACGEKQVDPRSGSAFYSVPCRVNIQLAGSCQRGDAAVLHGFRDRLHRFKITGRGDGESRLDNVHLHSFQAPRYFNLLLEIHGASGGLFTVPQGGVKYDELIHRL